MTVGVLKDLVLLRISGGRLSPENPVLRSDITPYIPDAVNSLMYQYYVGEQQLEKTDQPNPLFLQVFDDIPVTLDSTRGKFMFNLPLRPLSIPVAKSVRSVGLPGGYQFDHFYPEDGTMGAFWQQISRDSPGYSMEGQTGVLYNFPGDSDSVLVVKQLVHIEDYADDDAVIFVPSGSEIQLVDILYDSVTGQAQNPVDRAIDGKEDNK